MQSSLTIVLTLKGRPLHTLRWLYYANNISLPFPVIIADGDVNPVIEDLLADPTTFPNLKYQYLKYNDVDIPAYYFKCFDVLDKVDTPYVLMSDNDDFVIPSGVQKDISFLDDNPDYICSGGRIPGFSLLSNPINLLDSVTGSISKYSSRYAPNPLYDCRSFSHDLPSKRILEQLLKPLSVHYFAYRTKYLRSIYKELQTFNPSFMFCELFTMIRTTSLGKVHSSPCHISYIRQQASSSQIGYSDDLVHEMISSNLSFYFDQMVNPIANELSLSEKRNPKELYNKFYQAYLQQLRVILANRLLRYRFKRLFKIKQAYLSFRTKIINLFNLNNRKSTVNTLVKMLESYNPEFNLFKSQIYELKNMSSVLESKKLEHFISINSNNLLD